MSAVDQRDCTGYIVSRVRLHPYCSVCPCPWTELCKVIDRRQERFVGDISYSCHRSIISSNPILSLSEPFLAPPDRDFRFSASQGRGFPIVSSFMPLFRNQKLLVTASLVSLSRLPPVIVVPVVSVPVPETFEVDSSCSAPLRPRPDLQDFEDAGCFVQLLLSSSSSSLR